MSLDVELVAAEGECPHCGRNDRKVVFEYNITHNLNHMAKAAGVYEYCWRPEELGLTKASELVPHLRHGVIWLMENKEEALKHNPTNGWGNYDDLLKFVSNYLLACEMYPAAKIYVSR